MLTTTPTAPICNVVQISMTFPSLYCLYVCLQCGEVPSWMFLGWLGQLTALLDKPESPAVQELLVRLAEDYPHVSNGCISLLLSRLLRLPSQCYSGRQLGKIKASDENEQPLSLPDGLVIIVIITNILPISYFLFAVNLLEERSFSYEQFDKLVTMSDFCLADQLAFCPFLPRIEF